LPSIHGFDNKKISFGWNDLHFQGARRSVILDDRQLWVADSTDPRDERDRCAKQLGAELRREARQSSIQDVSSQTY